MRSSLTPSWIFLTYFNQFSGMLTWGLGWNKILSMWRSLEINESISSCRTNLLTNDPVSLIPPAKFGEWVSRARILHASTFLQPPLPARPVRFCRWHLNSFALNGILNARSNWCTLSTELGPSLLFPSPIDSDTFSHNLRVGDKLVLFCNGWEVIRGMRDVGRMPGVNGSNGSNGLMG